MPGEYDVGATGLRILDLFTVQTRLPRLIEQLSPIAAAQVERELAALARLGLVFQAGDMVMSLILEPFVTAADLGRAGALAAEPRTATAGSRPAHLAVG